MITFKEIEMTGFKSFADETHINFDGGITAIVGPNGCGKSNVSDAIRWVLGEQSSKALRGKSMQDVIFAGTEKRKKLSYCEVSLVFDNTNKWFNIDYDEVVITRKLYRNGESDYLINRKPCRLKDIRDLLYDSGIGKDGYSIIGQGRVEEIIQSKPEERRAIFEEAAGISKYKARKIETENRLARVRDNLSRASDIMGEVERRLGPLKRQSEDAKKFLEYRDVLKQLEINAYIYQYDHAAQTKEEINTKLQGLKDNLNVLTNSFETEQAKYDKSLNEINQLDKKASELHEKVLSNSVALEKKQSDTRLLTEQVRYLKEQIDRLNSQLDGYTLDLNQRKALVNSATSMLDEENQNLRSLYQHSQEMSSEYLSLIDQLTKSEGEKEENQRAMIDNLSKITDIKANLSAYLAKRDTLNENIKEDKSRLEQLSIQRDENSKTCAELEKVVNELENKRNENANNLTKINSKLSEINAQIEQISENIYALKTSISNDTNRKTILSNLQADFEGYQFAVKRLLQEGKKNPRLNSAIKGVVGNIISVDSKFQTAIEIALGGSIQNIVTADENDAKTLINYLKETKLGRATFLPISAVKPRSLSANDKSYLNSNGCLGIASQLVKTEQQFRPVIESLLGSTVVCDNLDNAVNLAKRTSYSFRIVTLEGDVLSPQGSMSGGSKKSNDSSLLSKENEIKALTENIEKRTKELSNLESQYQTLLSAQSKLNGLKNSETISQQSLNTDYYTNQTKLESIKNSLSALEEDIFSISSQIKVAENIVNDLNSKINSIDQAELDYDTTKANLTENVDNNAYQELKKKREEYQEDITASKVKIASTEEKIRALNKDIESQNQEIATLTKSIEQIQQELESQQRVYDEAIRMNDLKNEDSETLKLKEELDGLNNTLSQFDEFKKSLMQELKSIDDK